MRLLQSPTALALLALLVCCGCSDEGDDGSGPKGSFRVLATQPPDGAAAVPRDVTIQVLFNNPATADRSFDVTLARGNAETSLQCSPNGDPATMLCDPPELLLSDRLYTLRVTVDGEPELESHFTTSLPFGPTYDIGADLIVEKVGDSETAPALFEETLTLDGTMVVVLNEFKLSADKLPSEGYVLLGRAYERPHVTLEGQLVADGDFGYILATEGILGESWGFLASANYAYLPLKIDTEPYLLMLRNVELGGHVLEQDTFLHMPEIRGEALIPEEEFEDLFEALSEWAGIIDDLGAFIVPDVDTNYDDIPDACTLSFSSRGDRIELIPAADDGEE